jgi:hypothetical protein
VSYLKELQRLKDDAALSESERQKAALEKEEAYLAEKKRIYDEEIALLKQKEDAINTDLVEATIQRQALNKTEMSAEEKALQEQKDIIEKERLQLEQARLQTQSQAKTTDTLTDKTNLYSEALGVLTTLIERNNRASNDLTKTRQQQRAELVRELSQLALVYLSNAFQSGSFGGKSIASALSQQASSLSSVIGGIGSYKEGGFITDLPHRDTNGEPAQLAFVHKDEYVIPKHIADRPSIKPTIEALEAMRKGGATRLWPTDFRLPTVAPPPAIDHQLIADKLSDAVRANNIQLRDGLTHLAISLYEQGRVTTEMIDKKPINPKRPF